MTDSIEREPRGFRATLDDYVTATTKGHRPADAAAERLPLPREREDVVGIGDGGCGLHGCLGHG